MLLLSSGLAAIVLAILLLTPALGFAVPLFSQASPAPGAVLSTTTVNLYVVVNDDCLIRRDTATLYVDGVRRDLWSEWPSTGYWVDDGCGGYWETVYDYGTCAFFTIPGGIKLSPGAHSATLNITDALGRAASYRWDFSMGAAAPTISTLSPSPGSTIATAQPTISGTVSYGGTLQSASIALDGHAMPSSYATATGVVSYRPASGLADEVTHTATLTAIDAGGVPVSATWSFRIQLVGPMPVSQDCAGCHPGSRYGHPVTACTACHGGADKPVRNCPACHGGGHTQTYDFLDLSGQGQYTCVTCHTSLYPSVPGHPAEAAHDTTSDMTTCLACHVGSLTREHGRRTDGAGVPYDCSTCHRSSDTTVTAAIAAGNTACSACHAATSHEAAHATVLDSRCAGCHRSSLTEEHLSNPVTQATQLSCDSCHASVRPDVTWAIVSGDIKCSACHASAHALGLVDLPLLPMYAGYAWSNPLDASAFAGEPWMPADMEGTARVLVSDRRAGVAGDDVWAFYRDRMASAGWTLASAAPSAGSQAFSVRWTQNGHAVVLWFYSGQTHAAAPDGRGARIELIYR